MGKSGGHMKTRAAFSILLPVILLISCYPVPIAAITRVPPTIATNSTRPAGSSAIDLDVTYISRTPLYHRYQVEYTIDMRPYLTKGTENDQRWPEHGEKVTFTAHVMNKGKAPSGQFTFKWYIDGSEVSSGTHASLAGGEEGTETYRWAWAHTLEGEKLMGSHSVRFAVDPSNSIPETYETNNALEDATGAISLELGVTPELYRALENPVDPKWPHSAEDWLQKQVAAMNAAFARSVYPSAPQGITERVRLDRIVVSEDAPPADPTEDGGFFMKVDDRFGNPYYDPETDVSGALIHELTHQLGIIDMYGMDVSLEIPQVLDSQGHPVQIGYSTAGLFPGLMSDPGIDPPTYDEHTSLALNKNVGYRRGYYGDYLYDIPSQTYLHVIDNEGADAAGVAVKLYQGSSTGGELGSESRNFDNIPEISGTTDGRGMFLLTARSPGRATITHTNHFLSNNPFGAINIIGNEEDMFILELTKGTHQEFQWLTIPQLNLACWLACEKATLEIQSHLPGVASPKSPTRLEGEEQEGQVKLSWTEPTDSKTISYNLYRAGPPTYAYIQIASRVDSTRYSEPYDNAASAWVYAVTTVDKAGHESGFSNFFNAFRLLNPSAIVMDEVNRIILDPQNMYTLLYQTPDGIIRDTRGSFDTHLENSTYMIRDSLGRLVISHPGDLYTTRHSIRILDQNYNLISEFGETGSAPGQFEGPAGVAVWGKLCVNGGPYSPDRHTSLLLHFDGIFAGADGEIGIPNNAKFTVGKFGQGADLAPYQTVTYPAEGNISRTEGAIEFWVKPYWDGSDGQNYVFFEVGNEWFNRIRIAKDGANNLRLMVWDSTAEYGVFTNVSDWKAGEWHHVAASWSNTDLALYVDGKLRESTSSAHVPDKLGSTIIVGSSAGRDQYADAVIDELRISDIARIGNSDVCSYRILVADSGNNRLEAFDSEGNFIIEFGSQGNDGGQFNDPQGLAVDADGNVIVVDRGNNRLQVIEFDGMQFTFLRTISAGFSSPSGITIKAPDILIVADTGNNQIKVLTEKGTLLGGYTAPNDGHQDDFLQPRGVAVDPYGNIIVADTGNRRIVTILRSLSMNTLSLPANAWSQ
jgi:hypothetical protein